MTPPVICTPSRRFRRWFHTHSPMLSCPILCTSILAPGVCTASTCHATGRISHFERLAGLGPREPRPRVGLGRGTISDHRVDVRPAPTPDQRPTIQNRVGWSARTAVPSPREGLDWPDRYPWSTVDAKTTRPSSCTMWWRQPIDCFASSRRQPLGATMTLRALPPFEGPRLRLRR